jgi:hypothetical protein
MLQAGLERRLGHDLMLGAYGVSGLAEAGVNAKLTADDILAKAHRKRLQARDTGEGSVTYRVGVDGRDLVGQPEQALRTFDGEPSGAEFPKSPVQPPTARPANPSRRDGGIGTGAGVIDRPQPSVRLDGHAKVMINGKAWTR